MKSFQKLPAKNTASTSSYSDLESENILLKITVDSLQKEKSSFVSQIEILQHNLAILQRAMFGRKSEKSIEENIEQLSLLFDEAEAGAEPQADMDFGDEEDDEPDVSPKTDKKRGRRKLPDNLPRKQIIHDLPESQKICPCGCALTKIGEDKSEQLDFIPATLQIIEHIRLKYACKSCEDTILRAPVPIKPLSKANATSGFLAHLIVSKFEDHLPLYRQSMIMQRHGIDISRGTLCNWMIACGKSLEPLIEFMKRDIVAS